jgi:hypothetical protein
MIGALSKSIGTGHARLREAQRTFCGSVVVDPLFAWPTHPAGQTLLATSGIGWVQQAGGPRQHVQPGDVKRRYEAIAITKC